MARPPRRTSGNAAGGPVRAEGRKQARKGDRPGSTPSGRVRETAAPAYGAPREEWIAASEFKARCLELMDQVRNRSESIVITKHGVPVAQLIPYQQEEKPTIIGHMRGTVLWEGDLISPLDVEWDACADEQDDH